MFRITTFWLILLMCIGSLSAQKFRPHIENTRSDLIENSLEVTYDIVGSSPGQSHTIDLIVIDNMGNVILPDSVSGDVGPKVQVGKNKVITWDIRKEYDIVHGDFPASNRSGWFKEIWSKRGARKSVFISVGAWTGGLFCCRSQ